MDRYKLPDRNFFPLINITAYIVIGCNCLRAYPMSVIGQNFIA